MARVTGPGPVSDGAVPRAASVPEREVCSPPYPPVGSTCAGTGPPSRPGDTLYLKRLGKDGPHVTQPVVRMCDAVPANSELGCDSEEPPGGTVVSSCEHDTSLAYVAVRLGR